MSYVGKIKFGTSETQHLVGSTLYGTCATTANTANKIVELTDFDQLINGVTVYVKFTYTNTADNPTLNINSTGSKYIYKYSTNQLSGPICWEAGSVISFTYDSSLNNNSGGWIINNYLENEGFISINGIQTETTGNWKGIVPYDDFELKDGTKILYFLNQTGTGNDSLQLYKNDGTTTIGENYPIYVRNSTRLTNVYPAGTFIPLIFKKSVTFQSKTLTNVYYLLAENDLKVKQTETTTENWRKIALGGQNQPTAGTSVTEQNTQLYVNNNLEYQPSTGTLRTSKILLQDKINISYNTTNDCIDFTFI